MKPYCRRLVLLFLTIILVLFAGCGSRAESLAEESDPVDEISAAEVYLRALEERDPIEVDNAIKEYHRQELIAKRDERLQQLEDGEITVWSLFEDYAIVGDSRACGFKFMYVLDNSRILASYGETSKFMEDHIPELQQINPSYVFLTYGLNDVVQIGWETPEAYCESYREYFQNIKDALPNAKIFVNCIFPVYDPAFERWEKWREVPEYSKALGETAREFGFYFIENNNLLETGNEMYQEDGIHFTAKFHTIWATNMITAVYNSELGLEERDGVTYVVEDLENGETDPDQDVSDEA